MLMKIRSTEPQKLSYFIPLTIINGFLIKLYVMNRNERPNRSTNNGDKAEIGKCPVRDGVTE